MMTPTPKQTRFKELFLQKLAEKWWEELSTKAEFHYDSVEMLMRDAAEEAFEQVEREFAEGQPNEEEPKQEPKKRWRAEQNDLYYVIEYITNAKIMDVEETGSRIDGLNWNSGNYFPTREAAEKKLEEIKKILLANE